MPAITFRGSPGGPEEKEENYYLLKEPHDEHPNIQSGRRLIRDPAMHPAIKSNVYFGAANRGAAAEFRIYSNRDPLTGEDAICVVANTERDYFELEKRAQRRGKTVEQHLYEQMIPDLIAHGFNMPPHCFSVTVGMPGRPAPAAREPLYN